MDLKFWWVYILIIPYNHLSRSTELWQCVYFPFHFFCMVFFYKSASNAPPSGDDGLRCAMWNLVVATFTPIMPFWCPRWMFELVECGEHSSLNWWRWICLSVCELCRATRSSFVVLVTKKNNTLFHSSFCNTHFLPLQSYLRVYRQGRDYLDY